MQYHDHISRVQARLRRKKLDALLISQPENRRYLSGFTAMDHGIAETSGLLLIRKKGTPFLLTDSRYHQQAERETEGFKIVLYGKGLFTLLRKLLAKLSVTSLGFESGYTLHSTAQKLFRLGDELNIGMVGLDGFIEKMRLVKTEEEIRLIRKAVKLNEKVFRSVFHSISVGETEIEVALRIAAEMRRNGAERESFDTIVASAKGSSLPHAVPGGGKIKKNKNLLIDMGLILNGYCSDMTRSFVLGKPDKRYRKIHRIIRKAQLAGIAAVRHGVTGKAVDKAARKVIADAGYASYFGHALGHGVGMAVHEQPRISPKGFGKLKKGMVITIEPGIYIPGWGGVRLEDMVVVREDGCENLNSDSTWLDI